MPKKADTTGSNEIQPEFLNKRQAARLLGVKVPWLDRQIVNKTGPPVTKFGVMVRYRITDLLAWAERQRQGAQE